MEFVSTDTASDYNLYQLNPATNNWEFTGTANNTQLPGGNGANPDKAWDWDSTQINYPFDTTLYQYRFTSLRHYYMLDKDTAKGSVAGITDRQLKRKKWKHFSSYIRITSNKSKLVKIKLLRRNKNDSLKTLRFVLSQKMYSNSQYAYFPELRAFSNTVFYLPEYVTRKEFVKDFIKGKKFNDIKIEYTPGSDFCIIYLKDSKGIYDFEANITHDFYNKRPASVINSFRRNYAKYLKNYEKRIRLLNNYLVERKRLHKERAVAGSRGIQQSNVVRALTVSGLGVYNCDQIGRLQSPVFTVKEPVIVTENDSIKPAIVYVVDRTINGVLTYWSTYGVSLNKAHTKLVIAIDEQNNIYYTSQPIGESLVNNSFKMQKLEKEKITNVSQFAEIVGL